MIHTKMLASIRCVSYLQKHKSSGDMQGKPSVPSMRPIDMDIANMGADVCEQCDEDHEHSHMHGLRSSC